VRASPFAFKVALITVGLALALFVSIRLARIAGTRIIASGRAPNGVEFFVVQRFNWNLGERFTTGFHYRITNGTWGWYYYSHQDDLWSPADASVQCDERSTLATISRNGRPDISFDWDTLFYQCGRRPNLLTPSLQPGGAPPSWWSPTLLNP